MINLKGRLLTLGWGVNDADYVVHDKRAKVKCPYYRLWHGMLYRSITQNNGNSKSYVDVNVSRDWKYFSAFRRWVEQQPIWCGLTLDKDMLNSKVRVYSPETCIFIPMWLNLWVADRTKGEKLYPLGVTYDNRPHMAHKPFAAQHKPLGGKVKNLGRYKTTTLAHSIWQKAKVEDYKVALERYKKEEFVDHRVVEKINNNIDRIKKDIDLNRETLVRYWSEIEYKINTSQNVLTKEKTDETTL